MKKIKLTKEGEKKLKQELETLKDKKNKAIERLKKARAMGDLSENSEYSAAKEELAFIEGKVQEIEKLLEQAEIITVDNFSETITLGCKVTVKSEKGEEEFYIVGEFEADPLNKKISHQSPIGRALIGKKVGDVVEINVPAGKITYQITKIA